MRDANNFCNVADLQTLLVQLQNLLPVKHTLSKWESESKGFFAYQRSSGIVGAAKFIPSLEGRKQKCLKLFRSLTQ